MVNNGLQDWLVKGCLKSFAGTVGKRNYIIKEFHIQSLIILENAPRSEPKELMLRYSMTGGGDVVLSWMLPIQPDVQSAGIAHSASLLPLELVSQPVR